MTDLKTTINEQINTLAKAEKVTKAVLAEVASNLLKYVPGSGDIAAVNRLLEVLTPMNKQAAILFFKAHLEWSFDNDAGTFGDKLKGDKAIKRKAQARAQFFAQDLTFWSWVENNVEMDRAKPDYLKSIERAVSKAIKNDESKLDIVRTVMASGIDVDSIMAAAEEAMRMIEAEEQKQAA